MTCREKLKLEHPYLVRQYAIGGADQCPHTYAYMAMPDFCPFKNEGTANNEDCTRCWDREIPETNLIIGDSKIEHPDTDSLEVLNVQDLIKPIIVPNPTVTKEAIENYSPKILDSGNRREFGTGAVRDIQEGKGRCDLLPLDVIGDIYLKFFPDKPNTERVFKSIYQFMHTSDTYHLMYALQNFEAFDDSWATTFLEVAKHYEEGCNKYGARNWEKGIPVRCYIDSGVRHYLKYLRGDTDEPHDRAFVWNMLGAIWTCNHKPELNEYPIKLEVEG